MKQTKHRYSNFEVLRIVSMTGIIALHYLNSEIGGAIQNAVFPNFSWVFTHLINSICVPLVNCFVLISGYFLINRNSFTLRKSVDLLIITAFYGVLAYGISLLSGINYFSYNSLFFSILPFLDGKRWFVETYIILILLAPFLNKLLLSLNRQSYKILLIIQIFLFSIWYSIGFSAPLIDDGYGIINFITLYMIGGYLKLYYENLRLYKLNKREILLMFVGLSILTFLLSYFINPYGYAFITNILGATVLFSFFMKWNIGEIKSVNAISSAALDVYFVHSDTNTSLLLIYELLGAKYFVDTPWILIHMIFVIGVIWILGFCTYQIRTRIFALSINKLIAKVNFINKKYEI